MIAPYTPLISGDLGVDDGERGVGGVLDLHAEVLQAAGLGFSDVQPECGAVDVQVEGPAVGDVARYRAEGRRGDRDVELPDEGRDIDEAHVRDIRAVPLDERLDESAGRVDADAGLGAPCARTQPSSTAAVARPMMPWPQCGL